MSCKKSTYTDLMLYCQTISTLGGSMFQLQRELYICGDEGLFYIYIKAKGNN